MSRRHLFSILAALALVSSSGFARQTAPADLTGTWNGFLAETAGATNGDPAVLILKQTGAELSGSGGPNLQKQLPMLKGGKVATTKDVTTATFTIADETLSLAFDLKMVDGKLKGSVKGTKGDETRTGVAEFERAKAPRP